MGVLPRYYSWVALVGEDFGGVCLIQRNNDWSLELPKMCVYVQAGFKKRGCCCVRAVPSLELWRWLSTLGPSGVPHHLRLVAA